jgi:hypothetical protein
MTLSKRTEPSGTSELTLGAAQPKRTEGTPLALLANEIWERGERPLAGWVERVSYQMMAHVLKTGWTPERAASFYGGISETKMRSTVAYARRHGFLQ